MSTRLCTVLIMVVAAFGAQWPAPATAQVLNTFPVAAGVPGITARCPDAPAVCSGLSYFDPGTVEIFIYPLPVPELIVGTSFAIDFPPAWSVLDAELCAGSIVQGHLNQPAAGLRIEFPAPFDATRPILRYVVSAPTVGRWQFAPGPGGVYGYWRAPGGVFQGYWGQGSYLDVGDVCGDVALRHPCEYCELGPGNVPSAFFEPPNLAITVQQGETATAPLRVTPGSSCLPIPSCGSDPIACYNGFASATPWLSFLHLGGNSYLARIDASALVPGTYDGSAEAEGRRCCQSVCWPVALTVTPPTTPVGDPLLRSTWGAIKSIYR